MRFVCPSCGAIASLDIWEKDAEIRQFVTLMASLPHQVQQLAPRYLGLFRKGERGLTWKRALRLIQELKELVSSGKVHWEGGEERPASPELWAESMEAMLDRGLKEMTDHNYLRKVVWSNARGLAVQAENEREMARRRGHVVNDQEEPASEEDKQAIQEMLKGFTSKFGRSGQ